MNNMKAANAVFAPSPNRLESKAQTTNNAARAIIDAERAARDAKTAKLRKARLEMEAIAAENQAPASPKKKRSAAK